IYGDGRRCGTLLAEVCQRAGRLVDGVRAHGVGARDIQELARRMERERLGSRSVRREWRAGNRTKRTAYSIDLVRGNAVGKEVRRINKLARRIDRHIERPRARGKW